MDLSNLSRRDRRALRVAGIDLKHPNPGISWYWIIGIAARVLSPVVGVISEELKAELETFLIKYYHKAMETENPWDDFLARFLLRILDIPVPE